MNILTTDTYIIMQDITLDSISLVCAVFSVDLYSQLNRISNNTKQNKIYIISSPKIKITLLEYK